MHLHFDCFSGISGDMVLGALVDAGLSAHALRKGLQAIPVKNYRLKISKVYRGSIHATKVDVLVQPSGTKPLSWPHIRRILNQSTLPPWVKTQALTTFTRLAEAEGKIHGESPAKIHFHEVGVVDSLIDVVGGFLGCHLLGITSYSASPVNVGGGTVSTAHGSLPVPAPAVAHLSAGVPICAKGPQRELTTPTGLAILSSLTSHFDGLPPITPRAIGYGAGSANPEGWPNVLRVFLSQTLAGPHFNADQIMLLETNIDDMNPQLYESVMDRLLQAGALDVSLTPVIMKRCRPGIILSVLAAPQDSQVMTDLLFLETSTIGVRTQLINRLTLPRTTDKIKVGQDTVRIKTSMIGKAKKATPEFQDCLTIAKKYGRPVREVLEEALRKLY